jgi:predicted nucleic acid-binding protein
VINSIIFSEVSLNFDSCAALTQVLEQLGIGILDTPLPVAFQVSRTFKQYKKNKGDKKSAMPDFYIGAHAHYLQSPIITRDIAGFKTYYPDVELILPINWE